MRRVLPLILALALGAAAPLPPRPDADPVSLIAAIYGTYENDTPALPHIYSKRLQALIDKDARETPKGELGRIDWDMFVDGQVWKLSKLKIALVSKSAGHAEVRATFMNYSEPNTLLFELCIGALVGIIRPDTTEQDCCRYKHQNRQNHRESGA